MNTNNTTNFTKKSGNNFRIFLSIFNFFSWDNNFMQTRVSVGGTEENAHKSERQSSK